MTVELIVSILRVEKSRNNPLLECTARQGKLLTPICVRYLEQVAPVPSEPCLTPNGQIALHQVLYNLDARGNISQISKTCTHFSFSQVMQVFTKMCIGPFT